MNLKTPNDSGYDSIFDNKDLLMYYDFDQSNEVNNFCKKKTYCDDIIITNGGLITYENQ